jgi:hypothetical protein
MFGNRPSDEVCKSYTDTFITILYVMVDDFCQQQLPAEPKRPGPQASLSRSEVVTLALFGQWGRFGSKRGLYRWVRHHLLAAFPTLPDRAQFNRLVCAQHDAIVAFDRFVCAWAVPVYGIYELVDSTAAPTRDAKRRGAGCWLGKLTLAGAIAWAAMKGFMCSGRLRLWD